MIYGAHSSATSKSQSSALIRINKWWLDILPLEKDEENIERNIKIMLLRPRLSRIYYGGRFYEYPLTMNLDTIWGLGLKKTAKILSSYIASHISQREELTLEDFLINRFGVELHQTFFRGYTEKVWGMPCTEIDPDWGRQRIGGISLMAFAKDMVLGSGQPSLIKRFIYPKLGAGQFWDEVAKKIVEGGGKIHLDQEIVGIRTCGDKVTGISVKSAKDGRCIQQEGDFFISTMAVRDLMRSMDPVPNADLMDTALRLRYRGLIIVGLLVSKLTLGDANIKDNWIYIQDDEMPMTRIQIFNNWSPYMVRDRSNVFCGLEYFLNTDDRLWRETEDELIDRSVRAMRESGFLEEGDLIGGKAVWVPKAYPVYDKSYGGLKKIREYVDRFTNLFLVGRNGMHRYNNMDHSMLSAMSAVKAISTNATSKDEIWEVNATQDYIEG